MKGNGTPSITNEATKQVANYVYFTNAVHYKQVNVHFGGRMLAHSTGARV